MSAPLQRMAIAHERAFGKAEGCTAETITGETRAMKGAQLVRYDAMCRAITGEYTAGAA